MGVSQAFEMPFDTGGAVTGSIEREVPSGKFRPHCRYRDIEGNRHNEEHGPAYSLVNAAFGFIVDIAEIEAKNRGACIRYIDNPDGVPLIDANAQSQVLFQKRLHYDVQVSTKPEF